MKTIKNTLFITIITSIGLQLYLSLRYYQLHSAEGGGGSVCNINKIFNCDAVSASGFSNIAGIPISNFGLSLHLVLLGLLILNMISPAAKLKRLQSAFILSSLSLLSSIVMAGISAVFLNVYCLFCIGLYILSAVIWLLFKKLTPDFKFHISNLFNKDLLLKPVIAIAILSFFSHILLSSPKETKDFQRQTSFFAEEWESNPKIILTQSPMLTMGASKKNAKITIVEFADYLCPHCKNADPQIKAFVLANSKARLEFYPFPLDAQCNTAMNFSRGGLTCKLTTAVFCANKQKEGWPVHQFVFNNQARFHKNYDSKQFHADIKKLLPHLDFKKWKTCLSDDKTKNNILAFGEAGKAAKIEGTPSFLVNNRMLQKAQFLPILNAVKAKILDKQ